MSKISFILISVFLGSFFNLQAQQTDSLSFPVDEDSGKIEYQEVVEAEGKTKELFYRAITWMNDHWKNARGMIKEQDPTNGVLKAEVRFDIRKKKENGGTKRAGRLVYVLKMEFKDGRYRYTINNLNLLKTSIYPLERWINPESEYYDQRDPEKLRIIAEEIDKVIKSMKEGMKKEEEEDDDW